MKTWSPKTSVEFMGLCNKRLHEKKPCSPTSFFFMLLEGLVMSLDLGFFQMLQVYKIIVGKNPPPLKGHGCIVGIHMSSTLFSGKHPVA